MTEQWSPSANYDTQHYWKGCADRKLVIARCKECRYWIHPPRGICPQCWSDNVGHETSSGQATVYSYVVLPASRQGAEASDRITVWAELDVQERLIVVADLVGSPAESVAIGAPLELAWGDHRGHPIPVFRRGNA